MNQTTSLVSIEFLSWIKERLQEEAEQREQRASKRTASQLARTRAGVIMGLTLMSTMASSIF